MNATNHERPGVYSAYEASSIIHSNGGGKVVGAVLLYDGDLELTPMRFTSYQEAAARIGPKVPAVAKIKLLFLNGASEVVVVLVSNDARYARGFKMLEEYEDVEIMTCDSVKLLMHTDLRTSLQASEVRRRERIAVMTADWVEPVDSQVIHASGLNNERMVLLTPLQSAMPGAEAMAFAGMLARESDPAAPVNGLVLQGLGKAEKVFSEAEIDTLVRGGVTPLEEVAGQTRIVRAVTSRCKTGAVADSSWRELTTIRIVDDVIPGLRRSLQARFQRAKNTEQTRGAIRSQVVLELENKRNKEIITAYDNVKVTPSEEDPTVCVVEFDFTVAHGLNQLWLSAHITV